MLKYSERSILSLDGVYFLASDDIPIIAIIKTTTAIKAITGSIFFFMCDPILSIPKTQSDYIIVG